MSAWGKTFNLYKKYFYDRKDYGDIRNQVKKLRVPVLIVHGTGDKDVPCNNSEKIMLALSKKGKFMPIEGADHFFKEEKHKKELIGNIIAWLKEQS